MSQRKNTELTGILAAVITPFTADDQVDAAGIATHVDRLVDAGIHGIVPTGTTGEFTTLEDDEYRQVISAYVEASNGRLPVIAGIGALATRKAISLAQHAESAGADALMVVPPFFGGLAWDELVAFLTDVAESVALPIVYYNVPDATGIQLTAAQIAELGSIDGVNFLKSTSDDAVALGDLLTNHQDKIKAFNGWDTLTFFGVASGAQASVWGVAGILPRHAAEFWETLAVRGDLTAAREQWKVLWALSDFLESVNYVAGIKAAHELLGLPAGTPRRPILPLGEEERTRLAGILEQAGVLEPAAA